MASETDAPGTGWAEEQLHELPGVALVFGALTTFLAGVTAPLGALAVAFVIATGLVAFALFAFPVRLTALGAFTAYVAAGGGALLSLAGPPGVVAAVLSGVVVSFVVAPALAPAPHDAPRAAAGVSEQQVLRASAYGLGAGLGAIMAPDIFTLADVDIGDGAALAFRIAGVALALAAVALVVALVIGRRGGP